MLVWEAALAYAGVLAVWAQTSYPAIALYCCVALAFVLYPVAGCIADVYCGRYRVVVCGLVVMWCATIISFVSVIGLTSVLVAIERYSTLKNVFFAIGGVAGLFGIVGVGLFRANYIQFGVDQLQEVTNEEVAVYIHWLYWTQMLATGVAETCVTLAFFCTTEPYNPSSVPFRVIPSIVCAIVVAILGTAVFLARCAHRWFEPEQNSYNPYKTVIRVLNFARKNHYPLHRSSLTYCESEIPSRINLGKQKYGGPFTNEQVEDVKTFLRILLLLLCAGPAHTAHYVAMTPGLGLVANSSCSMYAWTLNPRYSVYLVATLFIPFSLLVLYPLFRRFIPGPLKRIGFGYILFLVALLLRFAFALATSSIQQDDCSGSCISGWEWLAAKLTIVTSFVDGVGLSLFYAGLFEFVIAQSPQHMKGLLIGCVYVLLGLFVVLSTLLLIPTYSNSPVIGSVIYLVTFVIGTVGLVLYVVASRKYKLRERDELSQYRNYVEEYYTHTINRRRRYKFQKTYE